MLALVLTMPTWAQGNEMIIASKADWGKFCDRVDRGETTLNAKMTADVDLGEDTWQVGAARNYSGTFDGQGAYAHGKLEQRILLPFSPIR